MTCNTLLYSTIPYHTILYYTILYYTMLYCTVLYYTILYYMILYYTRGRRALLLVPLLLGLPVELAPEDTHVA